jgi:hypothetical protein
VRRRHAFVFGLSSFLLAAVPAAAQCPEGEKAAIHGLVVNGVGQIQPWAPLRLKESSRIAIANDDGAYRFDGLCPGMHTVQKLDGTTIAALTLQAGDDLRTHIFMPGESSTRTTTLSAVTILLFAFGLLLFRHHNIVRTNRELLLAQVDNLAERIPLESDHEHHKEASDLARRASRVKEPFEKWDPAEWFFWSRGRELAGWMRVHELERQVVAFLVPEQRIVERAVYAEAELRQIDSPPATVLADRMRQTIQEVVASGSNDPSHQHGHAVDHLKQQLGEGLAIIYDHRDTKFSGLMEWHNKAMFLVYLALVAVAVLGLVFHHEELFLVGGVGGLMSRMARTLFREDVPSDYGASWTTLFLSPLLGAISAWIGIALIIWLREMNILDEALFGQIDWHRPTDAVMIAMAFTLGFSERLFQSLLSKVEGKTQDELNKPPRPPAPPAPLGEATGGAAVAVPGGAGSEAPRPPTRVERIVQDVDLKSGERVAFVGPAASSTRPALVRIVGAANVIDATAATIGSTGTLDGVLFETIPALADLPALAAQLAAVLQPDGRVVMVGKTPAALFDRDAAAQRAQDHAGPAVIKDALLAVGLAAQDPPEKLSGTDPVEWIVSFFKPAPGGSDR